jgi:aspartyl-tRNA(Asn)/glutamyl-tRNA(Gln) amidotransferase subunit C
VKITSKDVEKVALLSRLEINDSEMAKMNEQLNSILDYIDVLSKVNTEGVQPTAHVLPMKNVMREDVVQPSLPRDLALSNAPEAEDGYFKVPKVVEG